MDKSEHLNNFVEDNEPLARYIFFKAHFSRQQNRIKRHAFMPPSKNKNEVSVIRHKNCPKDCILEIGHKIASSRQKSLEAVSSIRVDRVRSINYLDVESDTSKGQHRRHANIKGFCNYTDAKVRDIAQKLANSAHLLYVI